MNMVDDPYQVLGISRDATQDEIRKAYRRKAKENHPDLHPGDPNATQRMNEINEAYDMLSNPGKYAYRRTQQQGQSSYGGQQQNGNGQNGNYDQRQQYAGSRGPGVWYSDFDFDNAFGFGSYSNQAAQPTIEPEDSTTIEMVVQSINSGQYQLAVHYLSQTESTDRNARWFYLSALANQGLGNTMLALEHIQRAVQIEPNHPVYQQILQQFRQAGRTYRENGQGFNMDAMDMQRFCMRLCYMQMFCYCCC